jgi:hypothetical protein
MSKTKKPRNKKMSQVKKDNIREQQFAKSNQFALSDVKNSGKFSANINTSNTKVFRGASRGG